MEIIDAFFLVNFLPFGIIVLFGVFLFFKGGHKQEKWYYPLLFIIIVLIFVTASRVTVAEISRRYVMPALVPGIIVGIFTIMLLPGVLKHFKVKYATAMVRTTIVIILLACIVKAMRSQESKLYLQEISKSLQQNCDKNNSRKAALLILGDAGGHIVIPESIEVIDIPKNILNKKFTDADADLTSLSGVLYPESLKILYPHLYLLCIEHNSDSFRSAWEKKFKEKPELIYESINRKQIAYRLYKIKSPYKTAWMKQDELKSAIASGKNLIRDDQFKLCPNKRVDNILRGLGISINGGGEVFEPAGWYINPDDGRWNKSYNPVSITTNKDNSELTVKSNSDWITLYSRETLETGKPYLISFEARTEDKGRLTLSAYTYKGNSFASDYKLRVIELDNHYSRHLIPLQLTEPVRIRLVLTLSGAVSIKNIIVIQCEKMSAE